MGRERDTSCSLFCLREIKTRCAPPSVWQLHSCKEYLESWLAAQRIEFWCNPRGLHIGRTFVYCFFEPVKGVGLIAEPEIDGTDGPRAHIPMARLGKQAAKLGICFYPVAGQSIRIGQSGRNGLAAGVDAMRGFQIGDTFSIFTLQQEHFTAPQIGLG